MNIQMITLFSSIIVFKSLAITNILYGYAYYIAPSILAIATVLLYRKMFDHRLSDNVFFIIVLTLSSIVSYNVLGLVYGFGINTAVLNKLGYFLLLLYYIPFYVLVEMTRYTYIAGSPVHGETLFKRIMLVSAVLAVLEQPGPQLVNPSSATLMLYMVSTMRNTVLSIIALRYGLINQLIYRLAPLYFEKLAPILPSVKLSANLLFSSTLSLVHITILAIYFTWRNNGAKTRRFSENKALIQRRRRSTILAYTAKYIAFSLLIALSLSLLAGFRFFVVSSNSMNPALNVGDLIITSNDHVLRRGDIIVFFTEGKIVVHRIYEVLDENGKPLYRTKGDALNDPDPWILGRENVIGRVVYSIPFIGLPYFYLLLFMNNYLDSILFIVVLSVLLNMFYIVRGVVVD